MSFVTEDDTLKSRRHKLTPRQRREAILLYTRGEKTCPELAARFGISVPGMTKLLARAGAKKGSRAQEIEEKVNAALNERTVEQVNELVERIKSTKEEVHKVATGIRRLIAKELAKMQQEGRSGATIKQAMNGYLAAASALKLTTEVESMVLNIKPDELDADGLPELPLREIDDETAQKIAREAESRVGVDDLDMIPEPSEGAFPAPDDGSDAGA